MNFINGQLVRHSRHSGFKLAIVVSLAAGHGYRILVWRAASCKWTTVPKLVDGSELHKLTDEEQRIRGRMITTAVVKAERFRQAFALGEVTL